MAITHKIYSEENYIFIDSLSDGSLYDFSADEVKITRNSIDGSLYAIKHNYRVVFSAIRATDIGKKNGDAYTLEEFEQWRLKYSGEDVPDITVPDRAKLMKTGQVVSYRTGDDGYVQQGRSDTFFKLNEPHEWGHPFRFCGINGGYTDGVDYFDVNGNTSTKETEFPHSLVFDFSAGDENSILTYYIGETVNRSFNDSCHLHKESTFGGLLGWTFWNIIEAENLRSPAIISYQMNYPPFNFGSTRRYFIVSTGHSTRCVYFDLGNYYQTNSIPHTSPMQGIYTRYTAKSEIGL
ncbi:MAG: hypothetical protein MK066_14610 [Crocinitomicaceae bacterium]|nr:hypothetical protein [Crocinitomicaceae bacterium]